MPSQQRKQFLYASITTLSQLLPSIQKVLYSKQSSIFHFKTLKQQTLYKTQLTNQQECQNQDMQPSIMIERNIKIVKILLMLTKLTQSLRKRVKQTINLLLLDYQLKQSQELIGVHPQLAECQKFQQLYGNYYEGLNIKSNFGYQYNFIYYIRKVLYTFLLVFCYYNPILQTTLCFLTFATGIILLLCKNPYETKRQFIQQFIQEFSVSVILFITILFAFDDQTSTFNENTKIIIGWVVIAFILLSLFAEILTLIYEIILSLCHFIYVNHKFKKNNFSYQKKPITQGPQKMQNPPVVNEKKKK